MVFSIAMMPNGSFCNCIAQNKSLKILLGTILISSFSKYSFAAIS
jgi:hypothetical protein